MTAAKSRKSPSVSARHKAAAKEALAAEREMAARGARPSKPLLTAAEAVAAYVRARPGPVPTAEVHVAFGITALRARQALSRAVALGLIHHVGNGQWSRDAKRANADETPTGGTRPGAGRPPALEGYGPIRKVRMPEDIDARVVESAGSTDSLSTGNAIAAMVRNRSHA